MTYPTKNIRKFDLKQETHTHTQNLKSVLHNRASYVPSNMLSVLPHVITKTTQSVKNYHHVTDKEIEH